MMTNSSLDSPLSQVLPNSLDELFNTSPDEFTGPDDPRVLQIVQAFRNERARWNADEKAAKAKPQKIAAKSDLNLEDLGL